jgi:hypothetical protein
MALAAEARSAEEGGYFGQGPVSHRDFFFTIVYTTGMKLT